MMTSLWTMVATSSKETVELADGWSEEESRGESGKIFLSRAFFRGEKVSEVSQSSVYLSILE